MVLRSLPAVTLSLEIGSFHKYFGSFPMLFKSWHLKDQYFVLSSNFFPLQGLCLIHLLLSSLFPFPLSIDSRSSLSHLSLDCRFLLVLPSHCPFTVRLWKSIGLRWCFRVLWFLFSLLTSASGIGQHNSTNLPSATFASMWSDVSVASDIPHSAVREILFDFQGLPRTCLPCHCSSGSLPDLFLTPHILS